MDPHLNLNWLRTFESVARLSGFTAASRELGLTQTAVSQHIKALETKLGQDLFIRRAKSIQLTEIGKAYLPSVRHSLKALNLSTNGLFGPSLESTLVVRASMAAILWLAPRLKSFRETYPKIGIKLVTIIWADTRDSHNADIDIVLAPDTHIDNSLEKLSDEFIVPVCSTADARKVTTADDLKTLHPIHIQGFDDHWARYMDAFKVSHSTKSTRLIVDTSVAAVELAATGQGCAILIEKFVKDSIHLGQSVEIVGTPVPLGQSHFISVENAPREKHAAVQAFKEWAQEQFAR